MKLKFFSIFVLTIISSFVNIVGGVNCYFSLEQIEVNYTLTSDNVPLLSDKITVPTDGHCVLTVAWLKNPISSTIDFGFDTDSPAVTSLNDTLLVELRNQLKGEDILTRTSKKIQYRCRSADLCSDETNLRKILHVLEFKENFSSQLDSLIADNPSFDQQSIADCYYNRDGTSTNCPARDPIRCPRCVTYADLIQKNDCGTCPTQTSDANTILWSNRYLFDNRSMIQSVIELSCQSGRFCNGLENIQRIQELGSIKFDFEKFYPSSSLGLHVNLNHLLIVISFFLYFVHSFE